MELTRENIAALPGGAQVLSGAPADMPPLSSGYWVGSQQEIIAAGAGGPGDTTAETMQEAEDAGLGVDVANGYSSYTDYDPGGSFGTQLSGIVTLSPSIVGLINPTTLAWLVRMVGVIGTKSRPITAPIWEAMPAAVKQALNFLGIKEGTNFALDLADSGVLGGAGGQITPVTPSGMMGSPGGEMMPWMAGGTNVVRSWVANGIPFYTLADGWTWVRRLNGTWKRFKYAKPTVIYGGGAGDLRTLLRASGIVNRQLGRLSKAIAKARPPAKRAPRRAASVQVIETGPGSIEGPFSRH